MLRVRSVKPISLTMARVGEKVPNDLLVAHAEKRVLRGALNEAGRQAADVEVRPGRNAWGGMG